MFEKLKALFKRNKGPSIEDRNMALHRKLKKEWDSNKAITAGQTIELMQVYTSRAGNLYFCHKNILDLHMVRQVELTKALQRIAFNVDDKFLDKWIKGMRDKINTELPYQMHGHLNDLELRRKKIPEHEVFLAVALPLIIRHDENPYTWQSSMRDAKLRELASDPDLHSFFLSEGFVEGKACLKVENLNAWKMQNLEDFLQHWAKQLQDQVAMKK